MAYQPRLPGKNNNISHQHPVRELILLLGSFVLFLLSCYWLLGLFIDYTADKISPQLEQKLFAPFAPDLQPSAKQQVLQQLTQQLQACTDIGYKVQAHYINEPIANAAAISGGSILIYQGLLDQIQTENALMFVLAHELAHLQNRDHLRSMGRSIVMATLIYSLTGSSQLSQLFTPAFELGAAQFSQQRELAADAQALAILYCHYGHIGGADAFFRTMQRYTTQGALPDWFDSHPQLSERLLQLSDLTKQHHYPQSQPHHLPAVLLKN